MHPARLPHLAIPRRPPRLAAAALCALALLVLWTTVFLGVHELSHLGQQDASKCPIALIAATVGGAAVQMPFVLPAPLAAAFRTPHARVPPHALVLPLQQARSPPGLA